MGQEEEIIPLFNQFFSNLPKHRSYDMAFKVYLQELADAQDKTLTIHSTRSSTKETPICIASFGKNKIPRMPSKTEMAPKEPIYSKYSASDVLKNNKKQRSMINLLELNAKNGFPSKPYQKPTSQQDPPTIYENVKPATTSSSQATSAPSTMPSFMASSTGTSSMSSTSSFGINQEGWYLVSSKPLKISKDLKIDLRDLF